MCGNLNSYVQLMVEMGPPNKEVRHCILGVVVDMQIT